MTSVNSQNPTLYLKYGVTIQSIGNGTLFIPYVMYFSTWSSVSKFHTLIDPSNAPDMMKGRCAYGARHVTAPRWPTNVLHNLHNPSHTLTVTQSSYT